MDRCFHFQAMSEDSSHMLDYVYARCYCGCVCVCICVRTVVMHISLLDPKTT